MKVKLAVIAVAIVGVVYFFQSSLDDAFEAGVNSEKAKQAKAERLAQLDINKKVLKANNERDALKLQAIELQEKLKQQKKGE